MAEFCLDCQREMDGIDYGEDEFIISKELDICEGCGQWKHVVVDRRPRFVLGELLGSARELVDLICRKLWHR